MDGSKFVSDSSKAAWISFEYVCLGLRLGRLMDGFVDAYIGDPRLSAKIANEGQPCADALTKTARELRTELGRGSIIGEARYAFLDAQLRALEVVGRRLQGRPLCFLDEVEHCTQHRPSLGQLPLYAAAHAELEGLLPGPGSLRDRYAAFRLEDQIPSGVLSACVMAVSEALRCETRRLYDLPSKESVTYEYAADASWSGFNFYEGDRRSRVAIHVDSRLSTLAHVIAHESYPGHHTEYCLKEQVLARQKRQKDHLEKTIFFSNTPQSVISEGLAEVGFDVIIGTGWGTWLEGVYAGLGIPFDGRLAEAISSAVEPLRAVRQDAAILLYEQNQAPQDVLAYLMRWGLMGERDARRVMSFLGSPSGRIQMSANVEGHRLLKARLEIGDPRCEFSRLLTETTTPATLRAESSSSLAPIADNQAS